jgi:LAO/AO transport system kinase
MGDDVQTIKAGIMEIADVFVINKADRDGAERVEREIRAMQSLAMRKDNWMPPIVKTIAHEGSGIPDLLRAVESYRQYSEKSDRTRERRIENWRDRIAEMLRDALYQRVVTNYLSNGDAERYAAEVAEHKRDPYSLVEELIGELGKRA